MAEYNNKMSTCNYVSLSNYYGSGLGDGPVTGVYYPQLTGVQLVPNFKGFSYTQPNYNSLVKGACTNYPNVEQAYIDGPDCVTYVERPCAQKPMSQSGYKCVNLGPNSKGNCVPVKEAPNTASGVYPNMQSCQAACPPPFVPPPVKESFRNTRF